MKIYLYALAVWVILICFYFAIYQFGGWKSFVASLIASTIWGIFAAIVNKDRNKQIESLARYKAEVHNLRIMIQDYQRTIHLANTLLQPYGLSVKMPIMMETMLPSVFDQNKK